MNIYLVLLLLFLVGYVSFRSGGLTKQEEIRRQIATWNCYNFPERYENVKVGMDASLRTGIHLNKTMRVAFHERIMGTVERRNPHAEHGDSKQS